MVTITPQLAPAASIALLQLSVELAMIAGLDSITAPALTAVEFGFWYEMLTVVD